MQNMIEKVKAFFVYAREHKLKVGIGAAVVFFLIFRVFFGGENTGEEIYEVKRGDVTSSVAVTGRVKPVSEVTMAFERTGRIVSTRKDVGERVFRGEVIASLDLSSPLAKLSQERAILDQLLRGSRPEEIAVKEAEVSKAKEDLQAIYDGVADALDDAFVKSEDALRVKTTGIFVGSSGVGYKLSFTTCDSPTEENVNLNYAKSEAALIAWRKELFSLQLEQDVSVKERALRNGLSNMNLFRNTLRDLSSLLNQQCVLNNSALDTYRSSISTANSSIASALANLSDKTSNLNTYKAALRKAESDLNLLKSGSDPEDIRAQEAKVRDAEATLATYQIVSPINGIVTKQDAKAGEIAYANTEVVSVISDSAFEIEINVPELDITSIKKGNKAKITFDAYGDDVSFEGSVSSVDPAETLVDNVPTYKVKVSLNSSDDRIKSGLTANIYIETISKTNVILLPSKAIKSESQKKYVDVLRDNGDRERKQISIGIRGDTGEVEVVSGLEVGEKIIISNANPQR